MLDGQNALKQIARDERRRNRAEEKRKASEDRRAQSAAKIRARAAAYDNRRKSTLVPGKRRRGVVAVYWVSGGISKLQPYSTREMILKYMKANLLEGEKIDVEKLALAVADYLYGDSIRPHLRKLEEAAHIEYVFK